MEGAGVIEKIKNLMAQYYLLAVWLLAFLSFTCASLADNVKRHHSSLFPAPDTGYAELYAPPSGRDVNGYYTEANLVWVYTAAFAERFRMPKQWIDNSLKGAEAIAYQRTRRPISHCTVAMGCGPAEEEIVQIFLPHNNHLPWPANIPFNNAWSLNAYGQSWSYLMPRQQSDIEHLHRTSPFLVPTNFLKTTRYTNNKNTQANTTLPFSRVADYQREVYPNLDFVSFVTYGFGALQQGEAGSMTLSDAATKKGTVNTNNSDEIQVSVPASFSRRVQIYQTIWETMNADYGEGCKDLTYPWPATKSYTLGTWQERDPNRSPDYVDAYTLKGAKENRLNNGGQYSEDPNIWVYTTEFAKRFGMPLEWADDSLKGAYAIAYRVAASAVKRKVGLNWDIGSDMVDVYLPSDAGLPWIEDEQYRYTNNLTYEQAPDFLPSKNESDADHWLSNAVTTRYYRTELMSPKFRGKSPIAGYINHVVLPVGVTPGVGSLGQGSFQRALYPGIDRLELGHFFGGYWQYPNRVLIFTWSARPTNGYWTPKKVFEYVDYRIEIPASFVNRAHAYDAARRKNNSKTFKTCSPKQRPWPPLCAANELPCTWEKPQPLNPDTP